MKTYIIEETALYRVPANSKREAERKFLKAIALLDKSITVEVPERDIYLEKDAALS